jgi:hypothetical protein
MMTGQVRSSVTIMGLDTHMILETVPVHAHHAETAHHAITGHHATLPEPCPEEEQTKRSDRRRSSTGRFGKTLVSASWELACRRTWPLTVSAASPAKFRDLGKCQRTNGLNRPECGRA